MTDVRTARLYVIQEGTAEDRAQVRAALWGLDRLDPGTRERAITAWVTCWKSGPSQTLEEIPSDHHGSYKLFDHVNEVTRAGVEFGDLAVRLWNYDLDAQALLAMCILHDVDKPMLFCLRDGKASLSDLAGILPHGVLGAMVLHDLDFPDLVVSSTALHSTQSAYHGRSVEARVLHYADMFVADHALVRAGEQGHYQGRYDKSPKLFV